MPQVFGVLDDNKEQKPSGDQLVTTHPFKWNVNRKKQRGLSLAETLVALGLLGVVMIPMLFMSSAFFTRQLVKTRNSMEVSHNSAQFLSRFMDEVGSARQILPAGGAQATDATHLYMAYYDPIAQQEKKYGYQLSASGSGRKLERLIYNTATGVWDAYSPYGSDSATQILLPASAVFTYCIDTLATCTAPTSNDKAIMVRLSGWTFDKATGNQPVALPTTDVMVGTAASNPVLLADQPRQLYSFPDSVFGNNMDARLLIRRNDHFHLTSFSDTGGVLSTILTGAHNPAYSYSVSPVDGRLYFGEYSATGKFYTWNPADNKLSVIISGINDPGYHASVAGADGRVYFGEDATSGRFWSWNPANNGLTVIVSAKQYPGQYSAVTTPDGRVYFGENTTSGKFWSWNPAGNGLTVILSGENAPGFFAVGATEDNRVYMGTNSTKMWSWSPSSGLTTVVSAGSSPGYQSMVTSNNRVYFANGASNYSTWNPANNGLTVLANTGTWVGLQSGAAAATGRVYFGEQVAGGSMRTWNPATNTTNVILTGTNLGSQFAVAVAPNDDRVYFGQLFSPGKFWTWNPSDNKLSVLLNADNAGSPGISVTSNGRVFVSDNNVNSAVWTWAPGNGALSALLPASVGQGYQANVVAPDGRFYFGEAADPGKVWTWKATPVATISQSSLFGGPSNQSFVINPPDANAYVAAAADLNENLYYCNQNGKTIDRYIPTALPDYDLASQMNWSNWTGLVGAMAVDNNTQAIALLDVNNKRVDVYPDRLANGTPAVAPTQTVISAQSPNPTGLAISTVTGNFLVVNSTVTGGKINLDVYTHPSDTNYALTYDHTIQINVSTLSPSASAETNFKILLDNERNVLFLVAPGISGGQVYALSMPEVL